MLSPSVNRTMRSGNPGTSSGMMIPRFRNAERNMEAVAQNAWRVPTEPHGKMEVNTFGINVIVDETKVQDDAVSIETLGVNVIVDETKVQDDAVSVETLGVNVVVAENYIAAMPVDDAVSLDTIGVCVIVMETY